MANDLNQCNFIGRLGADVEGRFMPNGDAVASFRIAVGWKSKDKEGVEWISVVAFGKLGQICIDHLKKGSRVFISGRFKTEKYTNKEGAEVYSTKIMADQMQMLDAKPADSSDTQRPPTDQQRATGAPASRMQQQAPVRPAPNFSDMDDDIPF